MNSGPSLGNLSLISFSPNHRRSQPNFIQYYRLVQSLRYSQLEARVGRRCTTEQIVLNNLVDHHGEHLSMPINDLKAGGGCVFELMECSSEKLEFRVQILRGDIPAELLENCIDEANKPIVV